jgi:hypothetical protein
MKIKKRFFYFDLRILLSIQIQFLEIENPKKPKNRDPPLNTVCIESEVSCNLSAEWNIHIALHTVPVQQYNKV